MTPSAACYRNARITKRSHRAMLVQLQLGPNPRSPWPGEFAVGQAHQAAISMPITAMTLAAMAARCGLIAQYAGCAIATSIGRA